MDSAPTSSDLSNLAHCHATITHGRFAGCIFYNSTRTIPKSQGSWNRSLIILHSCRIFGWTLKRSLNGSVTNQIWIKNFPPCKWLLSSVFSGQWSPVVFIENMQIFWAAPLLEICSCVCQVLSGAFYQIYSVCLLLAGCAPALFSMISGCKQQSVQLIAGWVSVPLGSLLLSNMSSQASCFYTWHITVCWQINLWALNGTQQDNVTQNNNVIHAGEKKIPLKNRDSLQRVLAAWCGRQNMLQHQDSF